MATHRIWTSARLTGRQLARTRAVLLSTLGRLARSPIQTARSIKRYIEAHDRRIDDPLIVVRVASPDGAVVYGAQSQSEQFADQLARLPQFAENRLLRAIERAARLETYEAADLLFCWAKEADAPPQATVHIGRPTRAHWRHAYRAIKSERSGEMPRRIRMLAEMFDACTATLGNDHVRFTLIEALGFTLSRALGNAGRYAAAAAIVIARSCCGRRQFT
jgi:hypothetical protein